MKGSMKNINPSLLTKILLFAILLHTTSFSDEPLKDKNSRIIIIGDTQHIGFLESLYWDYWNEHNELKTKKILKEISKRDPSFVLHLGDLIYNGSCESEWKKFDEDNKPIFQKKIPYYPIFGNHEYFGFTSNLYDNFNKRFPHLNRKKWYSFVFEKIGFIMINTNFDNLSSEDTSAQRAWYLKQLREMEGNDSITNIIVAGHHPPFTNSKIVSPNRIVSRDYANPFIRNKKTSLFFSGHCHSYERFLRNGKYFIVSGGGGGPRQKLNIDVKSREFEDQFNGPAVRFLHFCEIEIKDDQLILNVVKLNNKWAFSVTEKLIIPRLKNYDPDKKNRR